MRLLSAGILMLVVLRLTHAGPDSVENLSASDLSAAQCDNQVAPLANKDNQNPCQVAVDLLTPCNITNEIRPVRSTPCTCNLVFYNLFSACTSLCLQQGVVDYHQWTSTCPGVSIVTNDYPFKSDQIPVGDGGYGVDIPSWTNTQLSSGGSFDAGNVFSKNQTANKGWTSIQKLAPVIAVVGVLFIVLLTWCLRIWHRRKRSYNSRNDIHISDHDRSYSQTSMDSTAHLTHSDSNNIHFHRAWMFLGGIFNLVTTVQRKRRDTIWAIDDDEGTRMQEYGNDPGRRYQDQNTQRLVPNRVPGWHSRHESSSSDSGSSPGSPPRIPASSSPWWKRGWLQKFGAVGKMSGRSRVPKGSDYKSASVSSLQKKSGFRIDSTEYDNGLELLHVEEVHASGSVQAGTNLPSMNPPLISPNPPWDVPGRAVAITSANEQGAQRIVRDAEDGSVILISRVPGEDFSIDESTAEHVVQSRSGLYIQPNIKTQPLLRPNRLGNVQAPHPVVSNDDDLRPPDSFNYKPVESLVSLPFPPIISAFGSFERLHVPDDSFDPQSGPSTSGGPVPSIEQSNGLVRSSEIEPTLLFPAAVRAAGYSVPSLNVMQTNGHTGYHGEAASTAGKVNVHDRMQDGGSTSNRPPAPLASASSLLPRASPTPQGLPPYTQTDSTSNLRSGQQMETREDTLPPYSAPPPHQEQQQQQQHSRSSLYANTDIQRSASPQEFAGEMPSPDVSNFTSSPEVLTTYSPQEMGMAGRIAYPLASTELLPLSFSRDREER